MLIKVIILVSVIPLMSPVSFAQRGQSEYTLKIRKAEQEIEKLERQRFDAYLKLDGSALDRIMSDNYTSVYANGQVVTKAQELESIKSAPMGALSNLSATIDQLSVRHFGTAAVLSGTLTIDGSVVLFQKEIKFNAVFRYTAVYIKKRRNWQIVASQYTNIAPDD